MKLFAELRTMVMLRRTAIALEKCATALESLATDSRNRYDRELAASQPRRPKPVEISYLDLEETEKQWRKQREAEREGGRFVAMTEYSELCDLYRAATLGADEPNYMQMELGAFRRMVANSEKKGAKLFLAAVDESEIPDEAIVVISHGVFSILVDDEGRPLRFA